MLALRIAKVSLDRWHMDSVMCELFSLSRGTIAVPDQECFTPCMPFPPFHPSHRSSYQFLHAILSHRARITIFRVDRKTRTGNHCNGGGLLEVWMHAFSTIPSFSSLIIPIPPCHPLPPRMNHNSVWTGKQGLEATVTGGDLSKFECKRYISKQKYRQSRTKQKNSQ